MNLSQIATIINGELIGEDLEVSGIKSLQTATNSDLTILLDSRNTKYLRESKAIALVCDDPNIKFSSKIIVANPRQIFAELVKLFEKKPDKQGISKLTDIHGTVSLGENIFIDSFTKIGDNSVISSGCKIYSNTSIGTKVSIGDNSIIYPNVTIYDNCVIGKECIIHSGCVIGADGFGFEPTQEKQWQKIPQIAKVIIENNVEIGANTCIDRGAIQDTIICQGTKIDNLVQVGHNCYIGKHSIIAANTAIAGSTSIGENNMWGGQAGTAGHIKIGNNVTVAGRSGITKDIPDGVTIQGFPAQNTKQALKEQATLRRFLRKQLKKEEK